jgi:FKBP-type peptidyl-prolyl cis-trans isomerase FkpA
MKTVSYLLVMIATVALATSCNKVDYRKTSSGMLYKIFPSSGKDSAAKPGSWLKLYYMQKRSGEKGDTVLQSNYGKMPVYQQVVSPAAGGPSATYNPSEIFHLLKKGDSAVVVMFVDSLISKKIATADQLPPFLKKGDKLTLMFRVVDVFTNDSLYQLDASAEYEKDRPRQEKEREEEMAKMQKQMKEQRAKEFAELESSGEGAAQRKVVEDFLASKKITAQKTAKGTFVVVSQQGTGAQATAGKYVSVKYSGRTMSKDSTFDSGTYPFQLGTGSVIEGWDDGLELFKEGGKGILYIPGYLGYGKNPPPNSFKPNEPLIFDVEVLKVSDKPVQP